MKGVILITICLLFIVSYVTATAQQQQISITKEIADKLSYVQKYLSKAQEVSNKHGAVHSTGAKCTLCGIIVNELEGFFSENITEKEMEEKLNTTICSHLGGDIKSDCSDIVNLVPVMMKELDAGHPVSVVCVDHGYCDEPFVQRPDPLPVPTYIIDLDLPAELRWRKICSNSTYKTGMGQILAGLEDLFGNSTTISDLGKTLNLLYFPADFAAEIRGCAEEMGVNFGWLSWFNIGYEATATCTSIVAQTNENKILHVRNMDFWDGIWLTEHLKNITIQVDYQSKGKTIFHATTFAGYVGVLSGMRPNAFSISIDTRNYPDGIQQLFYEIIAGIMEHNASLVGFLSRHTISRSTNFEDAVSSLSNGLLIADAYYIVGGVSANQGAVISRNRQNASDVWRLQSPSRWYEVQTNYDHWNQPPWYDNRVDPANTAMVSMGRDNLSPESLLKVLSVKPVLNLQTTFSMLTCAAEDKYTSLVRNCAYPCAE